MTWSIIKWRFASLVAAVALLVGAPAVAQEGAAENPEPVEQADSQEESGDETDRDQADSKGAAERPAMQQTSGEDGDRSLPGGVLAVVAYAVLLVQVFGFVFVIMRRQRRIDDELAELEARLDRVFESDGG